MVKPRRDADTARKGNKVFYGWWIVAGGGAVQSYTSAFFWRGFTVFFEALVGAFGWSRGATAAAVSIQRLEGGMISPFVGTLIDKFGPRKVMMFGVIVTGSSFMLLSQVQNLWQFYLAIVMMTIGMSFGTFIVLVVTVGNWFIRRRALALGILMSTSGFGGLTLPLLSYGRSSTVVTLAALGLLFRIHHELVGAEKRRAGKGGSA